MRFTTAFLSFVLTCSLGVGFARIYTLAVEWYAPAFSKEEASKFVGRRVRNVYWSDSRRGAKCPTSAGACADVRIGECGSVIGFQEVSPNEYFLVVRWDDPGHSEPMLSYFGRMTRRVFLELE